MYQLYKLINRILMTLLTHFKFKLIIFTIIFYVFYFLYQTINNDFFITVIRCQLAQSKAERIRSKLQIYNKDLDLHPRNTRLILENLRAPPEMQVGWKFISCSGAPNEAHSLKLLDRERKREVDALKFFRDNGTEL